MKDERRARAVERFVAKRRDNFVRALLLLVVLALTTGITIWLLLR
jgi:hypothetical protein